MTTDNEDDEDDEEEEKEVADLQPGLEVVMRWAATQDATSDRVRQYLTIAALLGCGLRWIDFKHKLPRGWLDGSLVEQILSVADPDQVAELLIMRLGTHLDPESYQRIFARALANADFAASSKLLWDAGVFLDRHPGAFVLPHDPAYQLIATDDEYHQLAGIKSLCHSAIPLEELVQVLVQFLARPETFQRNFTLSNLRHVIDRQHAEFTAAVEPHTLDRLQSRLEQLVATDEDDVIREQAGYALKHLKDLKSA